VKQVREEKNGAISWRREEKKNNGGRKKKEEEKIVIGKGLE